MTYDPRTLYEFECFLTTQSDYSVCKVGFTGWLEVTTCDDYLKMRTHKESKMFKSFLLLPPTSTLSSHIFHHSSPFLCLFVCLFTVPLFLFYIYLFLYFVFSCLHTKTWLTRRVGSQSDAV